MKFAMAYSCGKDSTMAMKKMLDEGHELVGMRTRAINKKTKGLLNFSD